MVKNIKILILLNFFRNIVFSFGMHLNLLNWKKRLFLQNTVSEQNPHSSVKYFFIFYLLSEMMLQVLPVNLSKKIRTFIKTSQIHSTQLWMLTLFPGIVRGNQEEFKQCRKMLNAQQQCATEKSTKLRGHRKGSGIAVLLL